MKADKSKSMRVDRLLHRHRRTGAALIEFALVMPIVIVLMMGAVEMGRAVMVRHVMEEASRAGCRVAVFENGTRQDVLEIVDAANIENYSVTMDPDPPQNLQAFEPVTVSVSVPYSEVAWVSFGLMDGETLVGLCVMPAEGDGANDPDSNETPSTKKNKKNKANKANKKDDDDDDDD